MAEIIPFVPRNTVTRKPMTEPRCHDDISFRWLKTEVPTSELQFYADGLFYESSLGYVAPESDPA